LIIIPDEEIGWLPFDAFLVNEPDRTRSDWDGIRYLIHEYTISYSYSSSMLKYTGGRKNKTSNVFAFHPDYIDSGNYRGSAGKLPGAADEIESIYKFFRGIKFSGTQASETDFI